MQFLNELEQVLDERRHADVDASYTAKLFQGGLDRILKKVGEEAGEVIIAAKNRDADELANETADLLYHVLVMLRHEGLSLADVEAVLKSRHR